jgi:hypothetical protein
MTSATNNPAPEQRLEAMREKLERMGFRRARLIGHRKPIGGPD